MTVFALASYPEVCRICLHSIPVGSEIPLKKCDPALNDTLDRVTYPIPKNIEHLFPQQVCENCHQSLKSFIAFRSNMILLHKLMDALKEVKQANPSPIINLFQNRPEIVPLLQALDLCNSEKTSVDDLLNEFPNYKLAQLPDKCEPQREEIEDKILGDDEFQTPSFEPHLTIELFETTESIVKSDPKNGKLNKPAKALVEMLQGLPEISFEHKPVIKAKRKKTINIFGCSKCDFKTVYKQNIEAHKRSHLRRESKQYVCQEPGCMKVFAESLGYQTHRANHYLFTCENCGGRYKTKTALNSHLQTHESNPVFTCPYCNYKAIKREYVMNHVKSQHQRSNAFKCDICELVFTRKSGMMDHRNTHTKEKIFNCSICEKVFYAAKYLKKHVKVVHEKKRILCEYCPKDFRTKCCLLDHIEKDHGIQKRFICDICLKVSSTQSALDEHTKRHENPNHLECGRCLLLNSTQEALGNHLCISYRDDYVCCGRDQRHHTQFNKHMFLVHGLRTNVRVKPVPGELIGVTRSKRKRIESCSLCGEMFDTRTLKKKHMEICRESV
ncbi:gastrula zinc finger protein XlCGF26.1-like [Uranotaenia lowii]|uniref:gastrula zinc finger protein XlCGF26.1-like n=1 Tax=Uranotaenia lowii TaxID=190385 RepID=UPI002478FE2E|nr:gastrula zinc finger protein XlCGF26.1-like [Uranotaenia lowii]